MNAPTAPAGAIIGGGGTSDDPAKLENGAIEDNLAAGTFREFIADAHDPRFANGDI